MSGWPAAMRVLGLDEDSITAGLQVPLAPTLPQRLVVTADVLNVRRGPGAQHSRIGQLARGDAVEAWYESGGWRIVTDGDLVGWCSGRYLEAA